MPQTRTSRLDQPRDLGWTVVDRPGPAFATPANDNRRPRTKATLELMAAIGHSAAIDALVCILGLNGGQMKKFWSGPGAQIFGIVIMSFGAGTVAMLAFEKFLRGDVSGWLWAGLSLLLCFSIGVNCIRLRKTIPTP